MLARGYPRPRFLLVPALLIAGLAAITSPKLAFGRNWLVLIDGSGDAPTIQAAVDSAAAAGDSILVGPGTYFESVVINGKGLVIRGLEGRDQTTISGGGAAVMLTGSGTKKILGLTLTGAIGADGGGTYQSCAFESCAFSDCGTGASVSFIFGGGSFTSCRFTRNGTGFAGGWSGFNNCEFRENGSGATVYKSSFTDCDISQNGGNGVTAYGDHYSELPRLRLTNCNITGNGGYGVRGEAEGATGTVLWVEGTETNVSDNALGGLYGTDNASFTMVGCKVSDNELYAMHGEYAGFGMTDCEISGNGPVGRVAGALLTRCVVWGNAGGLTATSHGLFPGGVTLEESTYHANGNGIVAHSASKGPGRITITRSIVSGTLVGPGFPKCSTNFLDLTVECSDIFGNAGGDDVCPEAGPNNFSLDPLFCDASGGDFTLAADSPCAPANSPAGCELIGALPVGCQVLAIEPAASPQLRFAVGQNRPNPFNPSTVIDYTLPVAMPVALRVYDPAAGWFARSSRGRSKRATIRRSGTAAMQEATTRPRESTTAGSKVKDTASPRGR